MKYLAKLKPAQALLLLELQQTNASELLKVTFMDLIIRKVLEVKYIQKQANHKDPVKEYKFVVKGAAFNKHKIVGYEDFYLSSFRKSPNLKLLIPNAIKIGFENAENAKNLILKVKDTLHADSLIKQNYFQKLFGWFSLTPSGKEVRKQLKSELIELEKDLPLWIAHDKKKATDIMQTLGGTLYLMHGFDFGLLNQLDDDILNEFTKHKNSTSPAEIASGGCSGCIAWNAGFSVGNESGCNGSGCSGSGCSGCGGCGGD